MRLYFEAFLPDAISNILESCQSFLSSKDPEEAKNFLEFNKACKVALSNLEQLFKLYKDSELEENKIIEKEKLNNLLEKSRARIKNNEICFKED